MYTIKRTLICTKCIHALIINCPNAQNPYNKAYSKMCRLLNVQNQYYYYKV